MPINFAVKLVATVAIEAMQIGLQASQRTKGPRLDELTVTTAEYGTPLPRFLGARVFACPIFHAEDLKEVEKTSKIKGGGKQTTYHYLATFAAAIADNAIDQVLKIWFDDKLVYDATGTGPKSYAKALGIDLNKVMRIYYGSEDQLPDPRYASWCEDRHGADSAPAYRGVSYLFFEDMPVDNFGNRIPQIKVMATFAAAPAYPTERHDSTDTVGTLTFADDFLTFALVYNDQTQVWDTASRTVLATHTFAVNIIGFASPIAARSDGGFYGSSGVNGSEIRLFTQEGGSGTIVLNDPNIYAAGLLQAGGVTCIIPQVARAEYFDGANAHWFAPGFTASHYFEDSDGEAWAIGYSTGHFGLCKMPGGGSNTIFASGLDGPAYALDNGNGQFLVYQATAAVSGAAKLFLVDKATLTISASSSVISGSFNPEIAFRNIRQGATSIWLFRSEFSTLDMSLLRTINLSDWIPESVDYTVYDPVNDALICSISGPKLVWLYLNRFSNAGVTLGAIVSRMCDAAGLTDRDTSALTQSVAGYSWTRGPVKSQLEPLLDIHDVDARPHDFAIQFLPRGGAPAGTILTADLAKPSKDSPRYKVTMVQDTDLPKIVRVNFADTGFDQQVNNVLSPLPADSVDSERDETIDLTTYAASPDEAQRLSDRYIRRQWNSRESVQAALTLQQAALEPGDVTALSLDGITHNLRLTKRSEAASRIDCTFTRDETSVAAINTATSGPAMDGREQQSIAIPSPTRTFIVEGPYRDDADADIRPLLYCAAGAYAGLTFPGVAIYEATGAGSSLAYDQLFATISLGATWGTCSTTLGNPASPWLWDRRSTLTVQLQGGALTSVSEDDVDADPTLNLVIVGRPGAWEYLNFTTAALNGDGTWTLSGLKRGRRGTDWACSGHVAGECFIMAASLDAEEMGADDIGDSFSFKGQSVGRSFAAAPVIDLAPFAGATLKPWAPASIDWAYDGTDLTGTITRRTRVGGAWVGGSAIPLSEASEAYDVEIYSGTTLKRTISVTATNVFTYTAAMAASDGISLPTPPTVKIYQISDTVGRGYPLAA